jgi:hypothetical protein
MSGHKSVGPLSSYVKVADCYDPSSIGTLICVKSLEMFWESAFAPISNQFVIADHFFLFGEDD